jgi:hypothetical protein
VEILTRPSFPPHAHAGIDPAGLRGILGSATHLRPFAYPRTQERAWHAQALGGKALQRRLLLATVVRMWYNVNILG